MAFVICIIVGTLAGGIAAWACRSADIHAATSIAVGILGALLGLASDFWVATGEPAQLPFSEVLAGGAGAVVVLLLWILAQRLLQGGPMLSDSAESVTGD